MVNKAKQSPRLKIVHFEEGVKVKLEKDGFSNLILTKSTAKTNRNMMGYTVFRAQTSTKQKIHTEAEELAFVVSGSGKLTVGKKEFPFAGGDSLYIPAGVPHGVANDGKDDVIMVFFFSSPEYPNTIDA